MVPPEDQNLTDAVLQSRKETEDEALKKKAGETEQSCEADQRVTEPPDNKSDEDPA